MILRCVFLTQYSSVTDRQTDGRKDACAVAKTPLALHAVARKNTGVKFKNVHYSYAKFVKKNNKKT